MKKTKINKIIIMKKNRINNANNKISKLQQPGDMKLKKFH